MDRLPPGVLLPVKVLSRLFRRLFLEGLARLHHAGKLAFFCDLSGLADPDAFTAHLASLRKAEWGVFANHPSVGRKPVLAYLSRNTHRVAISNHRLVSADAEMVTFRWKDYRITRGDRMKVMRLPTDEFICRFLIHVLPTGFHRIRHTGFLANGIRRDRIKRIRRLLDVEPEPAQAPDEGTRDDPRDEICLQPCPKCGGRYLSSKPSPSDSLKNPAHRQGGCRMMQHLHTWHQNPVVPDQSTRPLQRNLRSERPMTTKGEVD